MIDLRQADEVEAPAAMFAGAVAESVAATSLPTATPAEPSEDSRFVADPQRDEQAEVAPDVTPEAESEQQAQADLEAESEATEHPEDGREPSATPWLDALDGPSSNENLFVLPQDPSPEFWPSTATLVFGVPYWLAAFTIIVGLALAAALTLFFVA